MRVLGAMDVLGKIKSILGLSPTKTLPQAAEVGTIVNLDGTLSKCVTMVNGISSYQPLTQQAVTSYKHTQLVSSKTWTITHNLGSQTPIVQLWDNTYKSLAHTSLVSDAAGNTITVTLGNNKTGYATVLAG